MPRIGVGIGSVSNLDVAVSTRAAIADYTAARAAALDALLAAAGLRSGTASVSIIQPGLSTGVSPTTGNPAWTYGAYSQIVAANVLAGHAFIGIFARRSANANFFQVQVAQGGVGAEVVIATLQVDTPTGEGAFFVPAYPFVNVPANARVAIRAASDLVGGAAANYQLAFVPVPL